MLTRGKSKGTTSVTSSDRPGVVPSLRISIGVALAAVCVGLALYHSVGFRYWREVLVGAVFMVATVAFYTELVALLLEVNGSRAGLLFTSTLKVGFLLLLLFPGGRFGFGAYDTASLVWFLVGVLTLLPTGAIIASEVVASERRGTANPPE
jgi:hypothetical protein